MEQYFIAGYYLMKTSPLKWGENKDKKVATLSGCINTLVFDNWCLSWGGGDFDESTKRDLNLTDDRLKQIHTWTDSHFYNLGASFPTLEMAREFKELFFKERDDIAIYSLSIPKTNAEELINDFKEENNTKTFNVNNGDFRLRDILLTKTVDQENENEIILGYDLIGIECDGSFHSFHCYDDMTKKLENLFSIRLNSNGLYDELKNTDAIRAYLNNPKSYTDPVPWYVARIKLIKDVL